MANEFQMGNAPIMAPGSEMFGPGTTDTGYEPPPSVNAEPRPIDRLVPNSQLHNDVLAKLVGRLDYSERSMQAFYSRWNVNEKKVQAYINLPDYEKVLKEMTKAAEPPQIVSITVPYTYATIWTIVTYLVHTFCGQKPIFKIEANSGESVKPAANMELVLQYNADHTKLVAALFQWFLDDAMYGVGVTRTLWSVEKAKRTVWQAQPMVPGLASSIQKVRMRVEKVTYEGNSVVNVDPFLFFPDPRVPMSQVARNGEFVFWRSYEGKYNLKLEELAGNLKWVDNIPELPRDTFGSSSSKSVRNKLVGGEGTPGDPNTRDSRSEAFYQVDQGTVLLVPKQWGLGDGEVPEKWIFSIGNKGQIIQAEPFDADHSKHPVNVIESTTLGYGFGQPGTVDMLGPIQDSLSWFINSHIYNVRATLNNMWVVDPSMIEMQDLKRPTPGKLVRMKRSAYGQDVRAALSQLPVQDVTGGHITDMQLFMRMGDQLSAVNDNLRGIQSSGGRKTATEVRTSGEAGASRLAARARYISAQGLTDMAEMMSLNCQQYMSEAFFYQVVGKNGAMDSFLVNPPEVAGDFKYPVSDGSLPTDKVALLEVWKEIWMAVAQSPVLSQQYDQVGIFDYVAELGGAKNISQFKVQVQPDEQVGNNPGLTAVGGGPLPTRVRPNGAAPGLPAGLGPNAAGPGA